MITFQKPEAPMLVLLDILLTVVHVAIVFFNLLGWIPQKTRKAHLVAILLTAGSWLVLGIWYGIGYCPFTDWQWNVKEQLGEKNLPSNFIEYMLERIMGIPVSSTLANRLIVVCFSTAALLSVYVNFLLPRRKRQHTN